MSKARIKLVYSDGEMRGETNVAEPSKLMLECARQLSYVLMTDEPFFTPLQGGAHMTREAFIAGVKDGMLNDDDGGGVLASSFAQSPIDIAPSDVDGYDWPSWATHVVWFNT